MKNYQLLKSIGILAVAAIAIIVVNMVGAAGNYPPETPPMTGVAQLLDTSSLAQAKTGNLSVGATSSSYAPGTTLDVVGAGVFDLLGVLGTAWFKDHFKIGSTAPVNTETELYVQGSRIRSVALANPTGQTICADSAGRLILCPAAPVPPTNGACGSANGTTPTAAPTTGLCSTGTASTVTGTGPWSWSCTGLNGGTTATCSTVVAPPQGIPAPGLIFYGSIYSGSTSGGAHDGIEWSPVLIPGTTTYATRYELQTFNPEKNFIDQGTFECSNPQEVPDDQGFCSQSAASNNWVTFGIIDYAQAPFTTQVYTNWTSGTTNPWNARIWDFFSGWGPNGWGSQTNLEGNIHNDNGCFSPNTITGCAVRVRALYGGSTSPWSPVSVLYNPMAPTQLTCKQKPPNGGTIPQYMYDVGLQNYTSGSCGSLSTLTNNKSLKLEWQKSKYDNQSSPFLNYTVGVKCSNQSSLDHMILGSMETTSKLILPTTLSAAQGQLADPNQCQLNSQTDGSTTNDFEPVPGGGVSEMYFVIPNRDYPAINFNPNVNPQGGIPYNGEEAFIVPYQQ